LLRAAKWWEWIVAATAAAASSVNRLASVIVGGAGVRSERRNFAAVIEALETDDVSSITDTAALFMRQFAESRLTDPTSLAGRDNDLKALAASMRSKSGIGYDPAERVDALRRVQTPVLAVVGDKDPILSEAQLLTETVPNGQLVIMPGEDHLSAVTAQEYRQAVASFLHAPAVSVA
jgi:pimeloyl-ACP methyl ester carboxylesterase